MPFPAQDDEDDEADDDVDGDWDETGSELGQRRALAAIGLAQRPSPVCVVPGGADPGVVILVLYCLISSGKKSKNGQVSRQTYKVDEASEVEGTPEI